VVDAPAVEGIEVEELEDAAMPKLSNVVVVETVEVDDEEDEDEEVR